MGSYRPPQRQIEAWILAGSRWLRGTFHVPRVHAFCEHLQKPRPFLVITDVSHGGDRTLPFLALRRGLVDLIVPLAPEPLLQLHVSAGAESRPVECWLEDAVVIGELALMPGVRISDFMLHHDGFFALRNAVVTPAPPGTEELVPCIIVNGREVMAVTEEKTPLAPDPLVELEPIGAEETA